MDMDELFSTMNPGNEVWMLYRSDFLDIVQMWPFTYEADSWRLMVMRWRLCRSSRRQDTTHISTHSLSVNCLNV